MKLFAASSPSKRIALFGFLFVVIGIALIFFLANFNSQALKADLTGDCNTGNSCTFTQNGVFFVPTAQNPVGRTQFNLPPKDYKKFHFQLDVKPTSWYAPNPNGRYAFFWFVYERNFNMIGYTFKEDSNGLTLRHGIGITSEQKARINGTVNYQLNKIYHFDYVYDTETQSIVLTVTDRENGSQVARLSGTPNVDRVSVGASPILIDFGFPDPATSPDLNQEEVPSIGWEYSNLSIEAFPGVGSGGGGGGDQQCSTPACNIGKYDSAYPECRTQTKTVPAGQTCTFTGTIVDHGPVLPNSTLYVEGNNCTINGTSNACIHDPGAPNCRQASVAFEGCTQQPYSITCGAGPVVFYTNDGAFIDIQQNCGNGAGTCGSANGVATPTAPTANLCSAGTASNVTQNGSNWTWTCDTTSCSAPVSAAAAQCGSANGIASVNAPAANLCSTGSASTVTKTGNNWTWTCTSGSNTPVSCTAPAVACVANADCTQNVCNGSNSCAPVCQNNQCVAGSQCSPAIGQCGVQCTSTNTSSCQSVCVNGQVCQPACSTEGQCIAGTTCETIVGQCGTTNPLIISFPSQTVLVGRIPNAITISGGTPGYSITQVQEGGTGLTPSINAQGNSIQFAGAASGPGTMTIAVRDAGQQTATIQVIVIARPDLASVQSFTIASPCDGQNKITGEVCTLTATVTFTNGQTQDVSNIVQWQGFQQVGELIPATSDLRIIPRENQTNTIPTAAITALLPINPGPTAPDPVTEIRNQDAPITISALDPERVRSFRISSPCDGQRKTIGDLCTLRATGTFEDGSTHDITQAVIFEGFETIGTVADGILTISERRDAPQTVAQITARLEQAEGSNRPDVVSGNSLTITVIENLPVIESITTLGNAGIAKGTTETLYIRVNSEEGAALLQDMEVWLIAGSFSNPANIPQSAQRFQLAQASAPQADTQNETGGISTLITFPVLIPDYATMQNGSYTFLVNIHTPSGNVVSGVAPTFLGIPPAGDVDLNGTFNLLDIISMMKIINGTLQPTAQQVTQADFNQNGRVDIVDLIQAIRALPRN